MDESLIEAVLRRAGYACEYCLLPQSLHPGPYEIEHVIPQQHSGRTVLSNLAYSCLHCNRHKGPNLSDIDRVTSRTKLVRLFNPRRHKWPRHFRWDGPLLVGHTPIGRVTVQVLAMNDPIRVALRQELIEEGFFSVKQAQATSYFSPEGIYDIPFLLFLLYGGGQLPRLIRR